MGSVWAPYKRLPERPPRHRLGECPWFRLKARLNPSSESYPTRRANGTQPVTADELRALPVDYADPGATPAPPKKDEPKK